MLTALSVQNFALVENVDVLLAPGLTAVTGESGAGKSILAASISMVLGARGERRMVRLNADALEISVEFDAPADSDAAAYVRENELADPTDPSRLIVRRLIRADGGSRAWVNASPVPVAVLRAICSPLVEIHGQFEQQQLLRQDTQLRWLDDFAGNGILRTKAAQAYRAWHESAQHLRQMRTELAVSRERHELLGYKAELLNALALGPEELEQLTATYKRLTQIGALRERIAGIRNILEGDPGDAIAQASRQLNAIDDSHESLNQAAELLATASISLDEARQELRSYSEAIELDNASLAQTEQRLDEIYETSRRLKAQPHELVGLAEQINAELAGLVNETEREAELVGLTDQQESAYRDLAQELSARRTQASSRFEQNVIEVLARIGLPDACFVIDLGPSEGESGLDRVDFLVSANPGFAPAPLSQVASGGELSRIALAIQVVAAQSSELPCLILDEADIGMSGTTADVIGRLLREISHTTQVICITHAAQVAAIADQHLVVRKSREQEVRIGVLEGPDRIEELARMLGGRTISRDAREYAKTLLEDGSEKSRH